MCWLSVVVVQRLFFAFLHWDQTTYVFFGYARESKNIQTYPNIPRKIQTIQSFMVLRAPASKSFKFFGFLEFPRESNNIQKKPKYPNIPRGIQQIQSFVVFGTPASKTSKNFGFLDFPRESKKPKFLAVWLAGAPKIMKLWIFWIPRGIFWYFWIFLDIFGYFWMKNNKNIFGYFWIFLDKFG